MGARLREYLCTYNIPICFLTLSLPVVMRKEAVLSLLLNAPLFKGMRCTLAQDPRYLRFSCFEDGSITHYNLRVGCLCLFMFCSVSFFIQLANTKVAGELLEEIEANIPSDDADDAV